MSGDTAEIEVQIWGGPRDGERFMVESPAPMHVGFTRPGTGGMVILAILRRPDGTLVVNGHKVPDRVD